MQPDLPINRRLKKTQSSHVSAGRKGPDLNCLAGDGADIYRVGLRALVLEAMKMEEKSLSRVPELQETAAN